MGGKKDCESYRIFYISLFRYPDLQMISYTSSKSRMREQQNEKKNTLCHLFTDDPMDMYCDL